MSSRDYVRGGYGNEDIVSVEEAMGLVIRSPPAPPPTMTSLMLVIDRAA